MGHLAHMQYCRCIYFTKRRTNKITDFIVGYMNVQILTSTECKFCFSQLVELKNGETYNGHLVSCDNWMNINLREVICTSRDGDRFWKIPECYVRGSNIKYLRIPDEV